MSRDEASKAASSEGGKCGELGVATVAAQTVCEFPDKTRAILTFASKGHLTRIHIIFVGDFDDLDIQKYLIESYRLSPDQTAMGLYKNGSSNRFIFSRMGSDRYSFDITNRDVALRDGVVRKAPMPKL